MNMNKRTVVKTAFAAFTLFVSGSSNAYCDPSWTDRVKAHNTIERQAEWVNPYVPYAAANFEGTAPTESADSQLANIVQDYKHENSMWVNDLVPYAAADFKDTSPIESADIQLAEIVRGYRREDSKWTNKLIPQPSADVQLNRIVAGYTREAFDRGGWINRFVTNSNYAAPYELLAAEIGSGVTTGAS